MKDIKTLDFNENTSNSTLLRVVCISILTLSLTGLFLSVLAYFNLIDHSLFTDHLGRWFLLNLGPIIFGVGNYLDEIFLET